MQIVPSKKICAYKEKDVWAIFTPLANKYKAVNLGQGFTNLPAAKFVKDSVAEGINLDYNQYSPTRGFMGLRESLSRSYSPLFNRKINPETDIMISHGANQGLYTIFQAFLDRDDEAILIEPYFDIYKTQLNMCDAKMKSVPLRLQRPFNTKISSSEWKLDYKELEEAINEKTKILILNTPHNPTGKVFSKDELMEISKIAIKKNLLVVSDEVYDRFVYEEEHVRIASLDGMWPRTITVGSGGKSFGVTGWRVGWLIGPDSLLQHAVAAHARSVFCASTPLQYGIAKSLDIAEETNFFKTQVLDMKSRRDYLVETFEQLGIPVAVPQGTFFIIANTGALEIPSADYNGEESWDYHVCRWLTTEIGVTAIPPSTFFEKKNSGLAQHLARFCICKTDETLRNAREKLQRLDQFIKK